MLFVIRYLKRTIHLYDHSFERVQLFGASYSSLSATLWSKHDFFSVQLFWSKYDFFSLQLFGADVFWNDSHLDRFKRSKRNP